MTFDKTFQIGTDAAEEVMKRVASIRAPDPEQLAYKITMWFFFCKAYKSFQAVRLLWKGGFAEDALALSRTIYELLLQAAYMRQNPRERAKLFAEFDPVARYAWYEQLKTLNRPELVKDMESRPGDLQELKAQHDRYKDAYPQVHRGWTGKSIRTLAKDLGSAFETHYVAYYWIQSNVIHSSISAVGQYLSEHRKLNSNCYPSKKYSLTTKTVPIVSTTCLVGVASETGAALELGIDSYFESAFDRLRP